LDGKIFLFFIFRCNHAMKRIQDAALHSIIGLCGLQTCANGGYPNRRGSLLHKLLIPILPIGGESARIVSMP
jgi:hypothetical protein